MKKYRDDPRSILCALTMDTNIGTYDLMACSGIKGATRERFIESIKNMKLPRVKSCIEYLEGRKLYNKKIIERWNQETTRIEDEKLQQQASHASHITEFNELLKQFQEAKEKEQKMHDEYKCVYSDLYKKLQVIPHEHVLPDTNCTQTRKCNLCNLEITNYDCRCLRCNEAGN